MDDAASSTHFVFVRNFFIDDDPKPQRITFSVPKVMENGKFRCDWTIDVFEPSPRYSYGLDELDAFIQAVVTVDVILSIECGARNIYFYDKSEKAAILPIQRLRELLSEK
jgi:hypothetical protein